MSTPHNSAEKGDFAKTVIMPGDPLRAEFIAENYLENAVCVNRVRGMYGYTGFYRGVKVSVQASGMGMPSMGIYSHELFSEYGVENIIRTGTIGGISPQVRLRDIVIAMSASTNSSYGNQYALHGTYAPTASWELLSKAVETAENHVSRNGNTYSVHVGNVLSSDTFYDDSGSLSGWKKMGVLGVEMETASLYMNASRAGKNALSIFTVSDCPLENLATTSQERQNSFTAMMEIALETAVKI